MMTRGTGATVPDFCEAGRQGVVAADVSPPRHADRLRQPGGYTVGP